MPELVLFTCVHDAGRSQLAAHLFNGWVEPRLARAISAGRNPISQVLPSVVEVLAEVGITVAGATPTRITPAIAEGASRIVAMGWDPCEVPELGRVAFAAWRVPDPHWKRVDAVRAIRDELAGRIAREWPVPGSAAVGTRGGRVAPGRARTSPPPAARMGRICPATEDSVPHTRPAGPLVR